MYRSILVPLDGSTFGEHALPIALSVARRSGATVQVVHVYVPLATVYAESRPGLENTFNPSYRQHGEGYLDRVVKRLADASPVRVTSCLLDGSIVGDALLEHVNATRPSLTIMTTHGRGSLARAWLGSVADDLVRRTSTPMLLARPHEGKPDLHADVAFRRVLVPLDGSEFAERIVEPALALGGLSQAEYTLLRVIKPLMVGGYDLAAPVPHALEQTLLHDLEQLYEQDRQAAERYLDNVAERLRKQSVKVAIRVATGESAAVAILNEVKAHNTDLVAIATHGRSALPRLFLGSVADKVLRGTTAPVLVYRPRSD
jgi:nucleotide-binding universal stress UspA family protein